MRVNLQDIEKEESIQIANQSRKSICIDSLIRWIRGKQVILDSDLAALYGVETKRLKEQVNRNISRFPEDFMFTLTIEEFNGLRSQIATSNKRGGVRYAPYAFTENGVAMLSSVLHTEVAIATNIQIMRAFTAMRRYMIPNVKLFHRIEEIEHNQLALNAHCANTDKKIEEVFRRLDNSEYPKQGVFFSGQIFDAYVFIADLVKTAQKRIVLIDNYINETTLALLDKRKNGVKATIYTKRLTSQLEIDLARHNAQYEHIEVYVYTESHDRFLIIDSTVYHIGASLKDLGLKLFAFSKMQELTASQLLSRVTTSSE